MSDATRDLIPPKDEILRQLLTAARTDRTVLLIISDRLEEMGYPHMARRIRRLAKERYSEMARVRIKFRINNIPMNRAQGLVNRLLDGGKLSNYSNDEIILGRDALAEECAAKAGLVLHWINSIDYIENRFRACHESWDRHPQNTRDRP